MLLHSDWFLNRTIAILVTALLLCFSSYADAALDKASPASQVQLIIPVAITAFDSKKPVPGTHEFAVANAFNGVGLSGDMHNNTAVNMWFSKGYSVVGKWIKIDLGEVYNLDHLRVWNYNQSQRESHGIQQADIYVALVDPGHNRDKNKKRFNPKDWTLALENQRFSKSPGESAIAPTDTHIKLNGIQARYLAIRIDSNYGSSGGNVGLSEMQIYVRDTGDPDYFTLTVNEGMGGGAASQGSKVDIEANPAPAGKEFNTWTGNTASLDALADVNQSITTVTMPASPVTVTATYKAIGVSTYALTVDGGDGDGSYSVGKVINIEADQADEGKTFDKWTTADPLVVLADANAERTTITMPASVTTVTAIYKPISTSGVQLIPSANLNVTTFHSKSPGTNAFSGTGLTGDKHDNTVANMWFSKGYSVVNKWIKIDLGGVYNLDHLRVWNFNQNRREAHGIQQADIYVAVIDPGKNVSESRRPFDPMGWKLALENQRFNKSPGGLAITPTDTHINLNGILARYLAISVDSNYGSLGGNVGLSEMQIFAKSAAGTYNALTVNNGTGDAWYEKGVEVNIVADAPPAGQVFDAWTGDISTLLNPKAAHTTLTMLAEPVTVTANFVAEPTFPLKVNSGTGAGDYIKGKKVNITAKAPQTGEIFDVWTGDIQVLADAGAASTTATIIAQDMEVTATYKPAMKNSLTVNDGKGSGSYFEGTIVSVKANQAPHGWVFDAWTGDTSELANVRGAHTTLRMPMTPVVVTAHYRVDNSGVWTDLFNGTSFKGWVQTGGDANYVIENGEIVGTTVANEPSSFLKTEKNYGDFILELEFKVDSTMNSGIQFRSQKFSLGDAQPDWIKEPLLPGQLYGPQVEIDPSIAQKTAGIVDYGRKDIFAGKNLQWLDDLSGNNNVKAAFVPGAWNTLRLEVIGSRLKTWLNNVPGADVFDPSYLFGFIALEIPANVADGAQIRWRNIRIQDRNSSVWEAIFNKRNLQGWHSSNPSLDLWSVENGVLHGVSQSQPRKSMLFTNDKYTDFTIRIVYRMTFGDSGLFFRTDETWTGTFNGVQANIVPKGASTTGLYEGGIGGRALLTPNPLGLVNSVYKKNDWNEMIISGYGNRVIIHLNGVKTVDSKTDLSAVAKGDIGRRRGRFGLQMHQGFKMDIEFKDIEVLNSSAVNSVSGFSVINTSENQVNLQWDRADDAASYQIWRDGVFIDEVWNTTYPDSFLDSATTYAYHVKVNNGFATSQPSEEISVTTKAASGSSTRLYPRTNISVTASSHNGASTKEKAFNNSGMSGSDLHTDSVAGMWASSGKGLIDGQWIKLDLGSIQTLDYLRVWNYNAFNATNRGIKQADIYIALTDPEHRNRDETDTYFHPAGWKLLKENQEFTQSPGGSTIENTDARIELNHVKARYVAIKIDSNYGDQKFVGLSEVQIYVSDKQ